MSEKKPEQKIMAIDADPAFDYGALQKIAMEADGITRTLDHLMGRCRRTVRTAVFRRSAVKCRIC